MFPVFPFSTQFCDVFLHPHTKRDYHHQYPVATIVVGGISIKSADTATGRATDLQVQEDVGVPFGVHQASQRSHRTRRHPFAPGGPNQKIPRWGKKDMGIHCLISSNGLCISPPVGLANAMETWLSVWVCHGGGEKTTPGNKKRQLASSSPMRLVWLQTHNIYIYTLVGGIPTPLKNMKVNWCQLGWWHSQSMESHKSHVPVTTKQIYLNPPSRNAVALSPLLSRWAKSPRRAASPRPRAHRESSWRRRSRLKGRDGGLYQWIERMGRPGKAGKQKSEKARIHRISSSTPYETYDRCTQSFEIIISSRNINNMK